MGGNHFGEQIAAIRTPADTGAHAARVRALVKARARDKADERLLLAMLGLDGAPVRLNAHSQIPRTSAVVHGTRGAVDAHHAAGTDLCRPCQRWADVDDRKHPEPDAPGDAPTGDPATACGSFKGWRAHLDAGQPLCPACRDYRDWWSSRRRRRAYRGTDPLQADGGRRGA
jgi:hypothetical protein